MKRDYFVDCLKGYACLAVVLFHVIMGVRLAGVQTRFPEFELWLENFLSSFHVPLFMFLSGYVFAITGWWESKATRTRFIAHKFINLAVPYFAFSIVYIIINSMTPGTNHEHGINDINNLWCKPVAQYWFLYSLLLLFVVWVTLSNYLNYKQILAVLIALNAVIVFFKIPLNVWTYINPFILVFGVAVVLPKLYVDELSLLAKMVIMLMHIVAVTVIYLYQVDSFFYVLELRRILGVAASIAFVSLIWHVEWIKKYLTAINQYSFPIYLLHTFFTSAVRIGLIKVGIYNFGIHVVLGLIFGLTVPIWIGAFAKKFPLLDFFFYPSKSIKRMKVSNEVKQW